MDQSSLTFCEQGQGTWNCENTHHNDQNLKKENAKYTGFNAEISIIVKIGKFIMKKSQEFEF